MRAVDAARIARYRLRRSQEVGLSQDRPNSSVRSPAPVQNFSTPFNITPLCRFCLTSLGLSRPLTVIDLRCAPKLPALAVRSTVRQACACLARGFVPEPPPESTDPESSPDLRVQSESTNRARWRREARAPAGVAARTPLSRRRARQTYGRDTRSARPSRRQPRRRVQGVRRWTRRGSA